MTEADAPRTRIAVACHRCRRRKIKCSGALEGEACEGCVRANAGDCAFADRPQRLQQSQSQLDTQRNDEVSLPPRSASLPTGCSPALRTPPYSPYPYSPYPHPHPHYPPHHHYAPTTAAPTTQTGAATAETKSSTSQLQSAYEAARVALGRPHRGSYPYPTHAHSLAYHPIAMQPVHHAMSPPNILKRRSLPTVASHTHAQAHAANTPYARPNPAESAPAPDPTSLAVANYAHALVQSQVQQFARPYANTNTNTNANAAARSPSATFLGPTSAPSAAAAAYASSSYPGFSPDAYTGTYPADPPDMAVYSPLCRPSTYSVVSTPELVSSDSLGSVPSVANTNLQDDFDQLAWTAAHAQTFDAPSFHNPFRTSNPSASPSDASPLGYKRLQWDHSDHVP